MSKKSCKTIWRSFNLLVASFLLLSTVAPALARPIEVSSGPYITITSPTANDYSCPEIPLDNPVTVSGNGSGEAPPGQIEQYAVQIDWGDGNQTNGLGLFTPSSGHDPFTFTFSGSHTYTSNGTYTVTATLYHETVPGNDGDADDTFSIEICVGIEEQSEYVCGNDIPEPGEQCDNGEANRDNMQPVWGQDEGDGDRRYCSTDCEIYTVLGDWCGDGEVNGQEECDNGEDNSNEPGSTCNTQCEIRDICEGADVVVDLDPELWVVGEDCHSSNKISDTTNVNIPWAASGMVYGRSLRGNPEQSQTNESFYLRVGSTAGPVSVDDADPNAITTRFEYLGTFDFVQGNQPIMMFTNAMCPPDTTANSVDLDKLCIYLDEPETEPATILAHKIICETEEDLPDWGAGGSNITSTTAQDYVDASKGKCWFAESWDFQWATDNHQTANGNYYGPMPSAQGWFDFDTSASGSVPASLTVDDPENAGRLWFREVLKQDYIPFVYPPGEKTNPENPSAEFYCNNDVLNYDNREWINNLQEGETYYCVGFNVPVGCGNGIVEGEEECDHGPNGSMECSPECTLPPICDPEIELIHNGSFEIPTVTHNEKWNIFPEGLTGWITDWVNLSPQSPATATLELHKSGLFSGLIPDGDQYAELDGDWAGPNESGNGEDASTIISQNLETWPGYTYLVSFDFSPRPDTPESDNKLKFNWNNSLVDTVSAFGGTDTSWTNYSYKLTATDWTTRISLEDAGTPNSLGTFVDNVSVRCVACDDSVYVRVNFNSEEHGIDSSEGIDHNRKIYTADGTEYDEDEWILIYQNGAPVVDSTVSHDYPGLIIERGNGWIRPLVKGQLEEGWKLANGTLEFSNGAIFATENDSDSAPGAIHHHPFENQGDNIPPTSNTQSANQDEYYAQSGEKTSDFYMMVTNEDDSYYLYYSVDNVCEVPECGNNIIEGDEECDGTSTSGLDEGYSCSQTCELIAPPSCGDGILNQSSEQCDGDANLPDGFSCSQECELINDSQECSDLVLARVNVTEVTNTGDGDLTDTIYLGSDSNTIANGEWFKIFENGLYINDPDISSYQDIPGLAVQRLDGEIRLVLEGGHPNSNHSEFAEGSIEFYNATVSGQTDDTVNKLEKVFPLPDTSGAGLYNAGNDQLWTTDSYHSNFWLGVTTGPDGFYTQWTIIEDCSSSICGYKWHDRNHNKSRDEEPGLANWTIQLLQFNACKQQGEEWADTVVEYIPGTRNNGTPILTERTDPTNSLGVAEMNDTVNFVSLGFGGTLILSFDNYIINGFGDDLEVIETSYGSPSCGSYPEHVTVYASQDGIDWTELGTECLDSTYDLGSLDWAKYIKLVDASYGPNFGGDTDGYDIDGVKALHCATEIIVVDEEITDDDGDYCFKGLYEGQYRVQEVMQSGWFNTTSLFSDVSVENGLGTISVNFGNDYEGQTEPGSICGYKFNDENRDGIFDLEESGIAEWKIWATNDEILTNTMTNDEGLYCFNALGSGAWDIWEEMVSGWLNTTDVTSTVQLVEGQGVQGINFGNYLTYCGDGIKQEPNGEGLGGPENNGYEECDGDDGVEEGYYCTELCVLEAIGPECNTDADCGDGEVCLDNECIPEPYCGDGSCNGDEDCNSCEADCGTCNTGGGGGGGNPYSLIIHTEEIGEEGSETITATITWHTNRPATSRVIYDTVSHDVLGDPPNYGYQWSTPKIDEDPKVSFHTVIIEGLDPDTTYYFRPISSASPEVVGTELTYTTSEGTNPGDELEDEPQEELEEPEEGGQPNPSNSPSQTQNQPEGIVAGVEYEEGETEGNIQPELIAAQIDQEPEDEPQEKQEEKSDSCVPYIWVLIILNLVGVGILYQKGKKSNKKTSKNFWWIMLLAVVVPIIVAYPECWLTIWLIITLVVSIALLAGFKKNQPPKETIAPALDK